VTVFYSFDPEGNIEFIFSNWFVKEVSEIELVSTTSTLQK